MAAILSRPQCVNPQVNMLMVNNFKPVILAFKLRGDFVHYIPKCLQQMSHKIIFEPYLINARYLKWIKHR